jgi:hypothetical protein
MTETKTFFGWDLGSKDISVEVECETQPDGTYKIVAMRKWQHDLELKANEPESTPPVLGQT